MPDPRRYWQEVRELERSLPEDVWLVPSAGGVRVEVQAGVAAQLLHRETHRLATHEEIAEHLAAEDAKRQLTIDTDLQRRGVAVVTVPLRPPKLPPKP